MGEIAFIKVLKIAPFRNLWLSQAISQIFLNLLFFSLIIRIYELTHSNWAVSLLVLLVTLPNILLGALAGILVDHWGRKAVMFASHFLRTFAVLAFLISPETLGWVYALTFLISVITQFFFPAEAATIYQVVKEPKLLLTANSFFSLTFFGSVIVGNVLAGPFLQVFGSHLTFFLVSLAFLAAAGFTARLPGNGTIKIAAGEFTSSKLFSDFLIGLDHIYHNPSVRQGIYILGASQIMIGILGTIAPGFADQVLNIPVAGVSLLVMAPAAAGMGLGALLLGQFFRAARREKLIQAGVLTAALLLATYAWVDKIAPIFHFSTIATSVLILMFLGGANAFLDIPANTLIQESTPEGIRSRVYGVVATVIGLAGIFPIMLSGALADIAGVRAVMFIAGLLLLAFALYNRNKSYHYATNSS